MVLNLLAQVVGSKTVWIAPPECSSILSRNRSRSAESSQANPDDARISKTSPIECYDQDKELNRQSDMLGNTSDIDVFSPDALSSLNPELVTRFKKEVVPKAMSATLEPGDMLFFPPGWWHAMKSEETSFSVSIWF